MDCGGKRSATPLWLMFVPYPSQDEPLKPKRCRASLAAALHMAVADTFNRAPPLGTGPPGPPGGLRFASLIGILWKMKANELRKLLRASPYHPITVCTGSNRKYSIPHPEFAALAPDGDMLVVFLPGRQGLEVLDVPLIERVEVRKKPAGRS